MKTYLTGLACGISLTALLAFTHAGFVPSPSTAQVKQMDGLYIFTDAEPVLPHDSLGMVELGFVTGTQYESIRSNLIKRAKDQFPEAQGLVMQLDKKGIDRCKAIRFR